MSTFIFFRLVIFVVVEFKTKKKYEYIYVIVNKHIFTCFSSKLETSHRQGVKHNLYTFNYCLY